MQNNQTPFRAFLAQHRRFELKIDDGKSGEARSGEELLAVVRALKRGWYTIILRTSQGIAGHAEVTRLISNKFREDGATRACIGIAQYCNDALREQESEVMA